MNTLIIVSVCLRVIKMKNIGNAYEFHFRGVFAGTYLKKLILSEESSSEIQIGKEYLIKAQILSVQEGVLRGVIKRIKPLDEYWDRS